MPKTITLRIDDDDYKTLAEHAEARGAPYPISLRWRLFNTQGSRNLWTSRRCTTLWLIRV